MYNAKPLIIRRFIHVLRKEYDIKWKASFANLLFLKIRFSKTATSYQYKTDFNNNKYSTQVLDI